MDALRTAVVLVLLLALGYGVWVVLNHDPSVEEPPTFDWGSDVADGGGVTGFGDGPFVPPADASEEAGSSYGSTIAADNAEVESGFPASTPGVTAPSGAAYAAASAAEEPGLPPPPPGFSQQLPGAAADVDDKSSTSLPVPAGYDAAEAATSSSASVAKEMESAPSETTTQASTIANDSTTDRAAADSGSRYSGQATGDENGYTGGSRYANAATPAGDTTSVTAETTPIPDSSTPLPPTNETLAPGASAPAGSVSEAITTAKSQIEKQQLYEALYTLSLHYGDPTLNHEQRREMLRMLDFLAGRVIYSTEHLLEPAYVVQSGEDLLSIAAQLNVPHQLLANINTVRNPRVLTPGSSLKVVRGPFRAEVDLQRNELTLFLGRLYAGRFPITVGAEPTPQPGEYQVRGKEEGKAYFGNGGATFPADHPANPYGGFWIDLGNQLCIHGSATTSDANGLGCVSLSPRDAADVFGILSAGSQVVIRR